MNWPQALGHGEWVSRRDLRTTRGTFAGLVNMPNDASLPRGSVLFVPGFTGSKEDFSLLLPLLAQAGWVAAAYDQRGQYETAAQPRDDFSLSGLAADAAAVSQAAFGTAERVHLVGHSFGGLVAATAAIEHSDIWASLTLMCSGPGAFQIEDKRRDLLWAADMVSSHGMEALYAANRERDRRAGVQPDPPDVEEFRHTRMSAHSPEALGAMARLLVDTPDFTEALAALEIPVSVLRGENDDAWPHDVQENLAKAIGTRAIVIPDAAHSPAREQPEETRDALARIWLA